MAVRDALVVMLATCGCLKNNPAFGDGDGSGGAQATTVGSPTTTDGSSTTEGGSGTSEAASATQAAASTSTGMAATSTSDTSSAGSTGSESSGDGTTDEPPAVTLCGKTPDQWIFSVPEKLPAPINEPGQDLDMWLSSDLKGLVWSSYRGGQADTYHIIRPDPGSPFDPATFGTNVDILLSTPKEDFKIAFSNDGVRAYHSYMAGVGMDYRIRVAARDMQGLYQPGIDLVLDLDGFPDAVDPHISWNELRLYFAATGSGEQKLAVVSRGAIDAPFGAPDLTPFALLDAPGKTEADPTLSDDERVLIFARNDAEAEGGINLYFAVRDDPTGPFGPPTPLPAPINTDFHEGSAHLTSSCELYFSRGHAEGPFDYDIYRSQLSP